MDRVTLKALGSIALMFFVLYLIACVSVTVRTALHLLVMTSAY